MDSQINLRGDVMSKRQFEELDMEDVEVKEGVEKFKFKEGKKYRIGFPFINEETGKVKIIPVRYYKFNQELKKSFLVPENEAMAEKCEPIMGEPATRFVTPVIIYATDKSGMPSKPLEYSVEPVVMDGRKVKALQTISMEWGLADHDVFVNVEDETYQTLTFSPAKNSLWSLKDDLKKAVIKEAEDVAKTMHQAVAADVSDETIKRWLSLDEEDSTDDEIMPKSGGSKSGKSGKSKIDDDDVNIDDLLGDD